MTEKRIPLGPAGEQVRAAIESVRTRLRMSFRELSERLESAGRPIPTLGLSRLESGDRRVDIDELIALAAALEVSPLELLGDAAPLFTAGPAPATQECPRCAAGMGGMERATRADLARLGELSTLETTLVEAAYRLAKAIDEGEDARALPSLTKELRATVQELGAGRRRTEKPEPEDDFGDLDELD